MPRTPVARVPSQQAGNSLFPAPPIQTTPPADREAGLAAGHTLFTVPLSLLDRSKDSMRAWTDVEHCSPTAPILSMCKSCSLTRALVGAKLSPGNIPLSAVATAQELAGEST